MFTTMNRALLTLALLLTFFVVGVRSACAQTYSPTQVKQMLKVRQSQANALNGLIQQLATNPTAQVSGSGVQQTIALYQGALANVLYQINQLQILDTLWTQALAVNNLIQNQGNNANLQSLLATLEYQISTVQATVTPL
jgi:hypothetical protein